MDLTSLDYQAANPASELTNISAWVFRAVAGHLPVLRSLQIPGQVDAADLAELAGSVIHEFSTVGYSTAVAQSGESTIYISATRTSAQVTVAAPTRALVETALTSIERLAKAPRLPGVVDVTFWTLSRGYPRVQVKRLSTPAWAEIEMNYAAAVSSALSQLVALDGKVGQGQLLIWTGPPGTGKTTALRALMREWASWCQFHVIIDPERLFAEPSYLLDLLNEAQRGNYQSADTQEPAARPWRAIVCEDADDFIASSNRKATGAGMSRLLNVADGVLGQGERVLILMTSNAPVSRIDPALLRPGRNLGHLEFEALSEVEAQRWLGNSTAAIPAGGLTLAELFERSGAVTRLVSKPTSQMTHGNYL